MKTTLIAAIGVLFATTTFAQPIPVRVYTRVDTGFVSADIKDRKEVVKYIEIQYRKHKKEVVLTADAEVSVEILSVETKPTGGVYVREGVGPLATPRTVPVMGLVAVAKLRFREHEEEFTAPAWDRGGIADKVRDWINLNASRLR